MQALGYAARAAAVPRRGVIDVRPRSLAPYWLLCAVALVVALWGPHASSWAQRMFVRPAEASVVGAPEGDPVVLVTLDGVRAEDVFAHGDRLPNLNRLARERGMAVGIPGVGAGMFASGPHFVSLPGYAEIFSGTTTHGCADNDCAGVSSPTLLDEAAKQVGRDNVAAFSSWERLPRAVSITPRDYVISAGRHGGHRLDVLDADPVLAQLRAHGLSDGPWPGVDDFRQDEATARLALRYLARHRPHFLFLGLGETDEYAHHNDYAAYLRALVRADRIVGDLLAALQQMGERGRRTHVVITTDHGRAHDFQSHGGFAPESSHVWLIAAGPRLIVRGPQSSAHPLHLRDVAPMLLDWMGMASLSAQGLTFAYTPRPKLVDVK